MITNLFPMLIVDLITLTMLMFLPVMQREKAFFGVRVSSGDYRTRGLAIMHRYWLRLGISFFGAILTGIILTLYQMNQIYLAATTLLWVGFACLMLAIAYREARALRIINHETRFTSSLKIRQLSDYTYIPLESLLIVLIVLPVVTLIYYYPMMPELIPIRFNWHNVPVEWAHKNFFAVFFLPLTLIYLEGWFVLLKQDLVHVKMTLPAANTKVYLFCKEQALATNMLMIDSVRIFTAFLLGTLSVNAAVSTDERLYFMIPIVAAALCSYLGLMFIGGFYYIFRLLHITKTLEKETGNFYVQQPRDEIRWKAGYFYYNPADSALFLEKPNGIGYTLNLANRRAAIHIVFFAGLFLWSFLVHLNV